MVGSDTVSSKPRALKGRDLITIGIFTALYFVVNFACMLVSGLHPYLWVFMPAIDDSFMAQISSQGMGADYLATLEAAATPEMMIAMFATTFVCGLAGAYLARGMFRKHFVKAGSCDGGSHLETGRPWRRGAFGPPEAQRLSCA